MKLFKILLLLTLYGCTETKEIKFQLEPVDSGALVNWEKASCHATYFSKDKKETPNNQIVVKYSYRHLQVPEEVKCILTVSFGTLFEKSSFGAMNLMFVDLSTNESVLYSLERNSAKDNQAVLTALVLSKYSKNKFKMKELEWRGPLSMFVKRFKDNSVFIEQKYKTVGKERLIDSDAVSMLYNLMWN